MHDRETFVIDCCFAAVVQLGFKLRLKPEISRNGNGTGASSGTARTRALPCARMHLACKKTKQIKGQPGHTRT